MGGRGRPGRWVLALAVLALLGPLGPAVTVRGAPPGQPDIVLVLVDDMAEADWRSLPRTGELLPRS